MSAFEELHDDLERYEQTYGVIQEAPEPAGDGSVH